MIDLNARAKEVHLANEKWWRDLDTGERIERNKGELLMLCVSEVAEAMEGERKGLRDDKLPHRMMAEVEMADVYIRLLDYAGGFGLTLPAGSFNPLPSNKGEALLIVSHALIDIYWTEQTFPENAALMVATAINVVTTYCADHGYDLEGAYQEKMAFNRVRHDHTIEARKAAGGKRW